MHSTTQQKYYYENRQTANEKPLYMIEDQKVQPVKSRQSRYKLHIQEKHIFLVQYWQTKTNCITLYLQSKIDMEMVQANRRHIFLRNKPKTKYILPISIENVQLQQRITFPIVRKLVNRYHQTGSSSVSMRHSELPEKWSESLYTFDRIQITNSKQ